METTSVRVTQDLYDEAKSKEKITLRKAPKQIEYWAQIGKLMEEKLNAEELSAVVGGQATVVVELKSTPSLKMRDLLQASPLEKTGKEWFQASQDIPGCLVRVSPDGSREIGKFANGKFIPLKNAKKK